MISEYKANPDQSSAHFLLKNSLIPDIKGEFSCLSGSFTFDSDHLEKSHIEAYIDVKTIDTGDSTRDNYFKSEDFFNIKKFPTIKFISQEFKDNGQGLLEVTGDLTVKNITKKALLKVEKPDNTEKTKIGITASTFINREKFKLELGSILEAGEVLIGDDIQFEMDIQLIKQS
ncbi:MAG: YceI family protein [Rhizobacter sp.]|nr:YceI family protein [Bacteriovorax sp.]